MKVYVASSWRNTKQPSIVALLRLIGHEVYDFREPSPGEEGFSWRNLDPTWSPGITLPAGRILGMLKHPIAKTGFRSDMDALHWCDACVLVLPCGRSAHLEAGWAAGAGKITIGLLTDGEPDLMWKMLDRLCLTPEEVITFLHQESIRIANIKLREESK